MRTIGAVLIASFCLGAASQAAAKEAPAQPAAPAPAPAAAPADGKMVLAATESKDKDGKIVVRVRIDGVIEISVSVG